MRAAIPPAAKFRRETPHIQPLKICVICGFLPFLNLLRESQRCSIVTIHVGWRSTVGSRPRRGRSSGRALLAKKSIPLLPPALRQIQLCWSSPHSNRPRRSCPLRSSNRGEDVHRIRRRSPPPPDNGLANELIDRGLVG